MFQEFSLMAGSIYENIGQSNEEDMDLSRADSVIEKAGIGEKIRSLPKVGHSKLVKDVYEDAVELSGGSFDNSTFKEALLQ